MKIVYICERPYNLFRTLLKAVNSDDEMDIVISNNIRSMDLIVDELSSCGLFNNVFYFNDLRHKQFSHPLKTYKSKSTNKLKSIKRAIVSAFHVVVGFFDYLKSQRKAKHIKLPKGLDFEDYDEIHITDCTSILNFYLYHKKYENLVYVEHAKDALSGNYAKITDFLQIFVKLRIIYGIRGSCRYIKAIEVNKNENLISDTKNKEIREVPLHSLLQNLSIEQKEFIYQLYAKSYNLNFPNNSIIDVFLTTQIDGESDSRVYVYLCNEVIAQFMADSDYIILKPHPNDNTDYSCILEKYPDVVLVPSCFSAEVFSFSSSLKIRKLINIDTSATSVFNSVEEVITLGPEFAEKCRNAM